MSTTTLSFGPMGTLTATLERQRAAFRREGSPSAAQRRELLARLRQTLLDHQSELADAVDHDFGHRSRHETLLGETFVTVQPSST